MKRLGIAGALAVTTIVVIMLLNLGGAHSAGLVQINLAAPTFHGLPKSIHNDGIAGDPDACPTQVPFVQGDERYGDLNNSAGSYEQAVVMPAGASVKELSLFANDNDNDVDATAYLIRKTITNGTTPKETGYTVMAQAETSGAANSVIRQFTDATISGAKVNNLKYMYYVELVVCANTVEPFAVRVVYST